MAKELIIWKNEAYVLIERIKDNFKNNYKHVEISLLIETENEILIGIHVVLKENTLKLRNEDFITLNGMFTISGYVDFLEIRIRELLVEMLSNYYTI